MCMLFEFLKEENYSVQKEKFSVHNSLVQTGSIEHSSQLPQRQENYHYCYTVFTLQGNAKYLKLTLEKHLKGSSSLEGLLCLKNYSFSSMLILFSVSFKDFFWREKEVEELCGSRVIKNK